MITFFPYIAMHVYTFPRSYTYTCFILLSPYLTIHVHIFPRIYTPYICVYVTSIYILHVPTSFYNHEPVHAYIPLRPNTYTWTHTSTHVKIHYTYSLHTFIPIYIYEFIIFYAQLLRNVFVHIRPLCLYMFTYENDNTPMLV